MVRNARFELATPAMSTQCSTAELIARLQDGLIETRKAGRFQAFYGVSAGKDGSMPPEAGPPGPPDP